MVAVLLVAAGLAAWYVLRPRPKPTDIFGNGTIEATEVNVSSEVGGQILELTVDEGDVVKAGQVLASLDTSTLAPAVEQARGAHRSAQANLAELLAGSREEQIRQARAALAEAKTTHEGARKALDLARENYAKTTDLEAALEAAKAQHQTALAARDQAKARWAEIEVGVRAERIEQLSANLAQAEAALEKAESDLARAEALYAQGALAGKDRDAAVTAAKVARGARDAAKAALDEARAGATQEQRRQARAALDQAEAQLAGAEQALRLARERYDDRLAARQQLEAAQTQFDATKARVRALEAALDLLVAGATKERIQAAVGQVDQATAAVQQAASRLAQATVAAPCDAVVLTKVAEPGETVLPGQTLVTLGDVSHPWLRIYLPLDQLALVYVGQPATVSVDGIEGRTFRGHVITTAEEAEFTPRSAQSREERAKLVFGVKIAIDEPDRRLKPGMPAEAHLQIRAGAMDNGGARASR